MKRKLIYMAFLMLITLSCTQEQLPAGNSGLASNILFSSNSASVIAKEKIYVWADKTSGIPYFNAWELIPDGQGGFKPTGEMQHFPAGNKALDFYALSGNFAPGDIVAGETPLPDQGLAYSVDPDQSVEAGYIRSDLLYAVQNNTTRQSENVNLKFYHMLSKVEVELKPGEGITAEELKSATVLIDARTDGNFTPRKVADAELADVRVRNRMLAVTGEPKTIHTLPKVDDATKREYSTALFFPQTVKGRRFITVILPNHKSYEYTPGELTLESGKQYKFRLTLDNRLKVDFEVKDWEVGDSVNAQPDLLGKITIIDAFTELPQGAEVNQAKDVVTMNHLPAVFTLAVGCDSQLEFVPDAGLPLTVEPLMETVWDGYNRFRITKTLIPPKWPEEKTVLHFRRKGLTGIYQGDTITLVSRKNPLVISGEMIFDRNTYIFDFGKYTDGEMGRLELPAGKKATLTFDQSEDKWAKIDMPAPNTLRILAGWRPNDPKADGRKQSATLTISDTDGSNAEQYIIKRENWGLPVVNIDGTWWCKYNLRGNGTLFEDQILSSNDPLKGKSPYEYLRNCTEDELLDFLGYQYQLGNAQGLPLTWDAAKSVFYYDGMQEVEWNDRPGISDILKRLFSVMVPPGYCAPSYENYLIFTKSTKTSLGGPGTKTYQNRENKTVTVSVALRDVRFIGHDYGSIGLYEFQVGNSPDKIVLCGLGTQTKIQHGNLSPTYLVLGAIIDNKASTWAITRDADNPQESWFKYDNRNNNQTNTTRCIKSPVEYMY